MQINTRTQRQSVNRWNLTFLFFLFFLSFPFKAIAQCAMCRAVLESEEGGIKAEAVNDGIVYLMAFPYLLVGILGYIIYRTLQNKKKIVQE